MDQILETHSWSVRPTEPTRGFATREFFRTDRPLMGFLWGSLPGVGHIYKNHQEWWITSLKPTCGLSGLQNPLVALPLMSSSAQIGHLWISRIWSTTLGGFYHNHLFLLYPARFFSANLTLSSIWIIAGVILFTQTFFYLLIRCFCHYLIYLQC